MDGGPSVVSILIFLVCLVLVIEFFHIGWLVGRIRHNSDIQTAVLREIFLKVSGGDWSGLEGKITMAPTADSPGAVEVLGRKIKCISKSKTVCYEARVRIVGKDGTSLIVEQI